MKNRSLFAAVFYMFLFSWLVPTAHASDPMVTAAPEDVTTAEAVHQKQLPWSRLVLLDARSRQSYESEHIKGAILPLAPEYYEKQALFQANVIAEPPNVDQYLKQSMERIPKNKKIVTYCNKGCQASHVLMIKLRALGYKDVQFMQDGIDAWKEKGYPVVSKSK